MSVKVMSAVFERYPSGGGERLLALALADVSRDDGVLMIQDSVPVLARKTCQSERGVQLQLKRMLQIGWLACVRASDGGRGRVSMYRINAEWIGGAALVAPARLPGDEETPNLAAPNPERISGFVSDETPNVATLNPERISGFVSDETPNVATLNPEPRSGAYRPTVPIKEIPPNPPRGAAHDSSKPAEPKQKPLVSLKAWLAQCKALGVKPIPPGDAVYAYAAAVGVSEEILELHWWMFKRQRANSGKRQRSWPQAFRNSVEGNWFRLWFIKPGLAAELTTQGLQAQAMRRAERLLAGEGGAA